MENASHTNDYTRNLHLNINNKDAELRQHIIEFLKDKPIQKLHAKQLLLEEGQTANKAYFIVKGLLRMFFYDKGRDISFQFFMENSIVSSFDSFYGNAPSMFYIESIEESDVVIINREDFFKFIESDVIVHKQFVEFLVNRFHVYQQLFLSRIKYTPAERYEDLIRNCPKLLQRVPQHYLASYLGITPVSLSRIRNRR